MKQPKECNNIQDIRREIDRLDREIINLLGKRFEYVKAASKYKTDRNSVKAPERFQAMLKERRAWAESAGLNPDVIEKMYQDLVNYFINEELQDWQKKQ
jgi:isochorismate pyruvate lyase